MKFYNRKTLSANIETIEKWAKGADSDDLTDIRNLLVPVSKSVRKVNCDYGISGILDMNDFMQEGIYCLLQLWEKEPWKNDKMTGDLDEDKIYLENHVCAHVWYKLKNKSNLLRTTIKKPVQGSSVMNRVDRYLSQTFSHIFDPERGMDTISATEDKVSDYNIEQLHDFLDDTMDSLLNPREKDILKRSFGIDEKNDKPISLAVIGKWYGLSIHMVSKIKKEAIEKLSLYSEVFSNFINKQ